MKQVFKQYLSVIKNTIQEIFGGKPSEKELMKREYEIIFESIKNAKTLGELFKTRAMIIKYNEAVKQMGSPLWAKNDVTFLDANWQRKYRIWKQLRG